MHLTVGSSRLFGTGLPLAIGYCHFSASDKTLVCSICFQMTFASVWCQLLDQQVHGQRHLRGGKCVSDPFIDVQKKIVPPKKMLLTTADRHSVQELWSKSSHGLICAMFWMPITNLLFCCCRRTQHQTSMPLWTTWLNCKFFFGLVCEWSEQCVKAFKKDKKKILFCCHWNGKNQTSVQQSFTFSRCFQSFNDWHTWWALEKVWVTFC